MASASRIKVEPGETDTAMAELDSRQKRSPERSGGRSDDVLANR